MHRRNFLDTYLELQNQVKKKSMYQGKNWGTEQSKGNKTLPEKVATTHTEDGHKQNTKTSTAIQTKNEGTQDDQGRDGGANFILGVREQETRLTIYEHDDDDGDNDEKMTSSFKRADCSNDLT